jgi:hypothetical protein
MNRKTLTLTAFAPLLALALACGGGGGGSTATPPAAVTVATPQVTAPAYLGIGGSAVTVNTQAQAGCTYAWTLSGDSTAQIATGQGTNAITVTAAGKAGTSLQASVTVQAETGGSSASGSASITEAVPPAVPQVEPTSLAIINDGGMNPGQQFAATASGDSGSVTYAWSVTGGTLDSGQGTTSVQVTAGTPSSYPGTLDASCLVTDSVTGLTSTGSQTLNIYNPSAQPPATPVVTGPKTAKGGATGVVYSAPAQAGSTYQWILYNGQQLPQYVTAGQGTDSATFTAPAYSATGSNAYTVCLTLTNAGGQVTGFGNLTVTQ